MIETGTFDRAQARKEALHPGKKFFRPFPGAAPSGRDVHPVARAGTDATQVVPPRYPIKCDLCDGLPFMGCVHACPTGAAIRIDPRTMLEEAGAVTVLARITKATAAPRE
jgi:ferredoxin